MKNAEKLGAAEQAVNQSQTVREDVIDAKREDNAAINSASGDSAEWLRDNGFVRKD